MRSLLYMVLATCALGIAACAPGVSVKPTVIADRSPVAVASTNPAASTPSFFAASNCLLCDLQPLVADLWWFRGCPGERTLVYDHTHAINIVPIEDGLVFHCEKDGKKDGPSSSLGITRTHEWWRAGRRHGASVTRDESGRTRRVVFFRNGDPEGSLLFADRTELVVFPWKNGKREGSYRRFVGGALVEAGQLVDLRHGKWWRKTPDGRTTIEHWNDGQLTSASPGPASPPPEVLLGEPL